MRILKDGIDELDIHIMRIVNLSIMRKTFPNKWKIGKVIPLFKGEGYQMEDRASYRPVYRIQHKAVRCITRDNKYTKISTLMNKCNLMSVNQLIAFHSIILLWKTWNNVRFNMLKDEIVRNNDGNFCEIKGRLFMKEENN